MMYDFSSPAPSLNGAKPPVAGTYVPFCRRSNCDTQSRGRRDTVIEHHHAIIVPSAHTYTHTHTHTHTHRRAGILTSCSAIFKRALLCRTAASAPLVKPASSSGVPCRFSHCTRLVKIDEDWDCNGLPGRPSPSPPCTCFSVFCELKSCIESVRPSFEQFISLKFRGYCNDLDKPGSELPGRTALCAPWPLE